MRTRPTLLLVALVIAATALVSCGDDEPASDAGRPTVVVTYSILGAVVRDVVGNAAEVVTLIPDGADPHDWSPSARDIERLNHATLVVSNGLGLESGLADALERATDDGVASFVAADHIMVRHLGDGEAEADHADEHDDEHSTEDPHLWTDPLTMRQVVEALGPALDDVGIDVGDGAQRVATELTELDAEVRDLLAVVPDERRDLVTGHDSLGYFADRYDLRLVGAIIPSLTSQAEVSSGDLAALADQIEATGAGAIFTELGTPSDVADAIGRETGVQVVELSTHLLPSDGTYASFLTDMATRIADALG